LAELDAPLGTAGATGTAPRATGGGMASPAPPPAPVDAAPRSKTVRLARLNPGLMRRLEGVHLPDEDPGHTTWGCVAPPPRHHNGSGRASPASLAQARVLGGAFHPGPMVPLGEVEVPRKWSMSLPPARRASSRRRAPPVAAARGSGASSSLACSGEIDPGEKALAETHDGACFDMGREDSYDDRDGALRELVALRRHCGELEEALRQLRVGGSSGRSTPGSSSVYDQRAALDEIDQLRAELRAAEQERSGVLDSQRRDFEAKLAEASRIGAAAEASAAAASERLGQEVAAAEAAAAEAEAKLRASEALRREEASAAASRGRHARAAALARGEKFAAEAEQGALASLFLAWRHSVVEERLKTEVKAQTELCSEAQAAEAAAEAARRLAVRRAGLAETSAADEATRLRARATAAEARLSCAEALHEAAAEEAERLRKDAEEKTQEVEKRSAAHFAEQEARFRGELASQIAMIVRERDVALSEQAQLAEQRLEEEVYRGLQALRAQAAEHAERLRQARGGAAPAPSQDLAAVRRRTYACMAPIGEAINKAFLVTVFAGWRSATESRKATGALQAKLFQEQSGRAAALRAQKLDLDTRYMEAEARHRSAMRRVRAELAEAEARHADALATQEAEAAQRLAAAEADFATALREANRTATSSTAEETGGSIEEATPGEQSAVSAEVLRSIRVRADARVAEAEARHAEALQTERERAELRFVREEKRHEEALRVARESAERRVQAAESRQVEASRVVRESLEQRVSQIEAHNAELLLLLQANGIDAGNLFQGLLGDNTEQMSS